MPKKKAAKLDSDTSEVPADVESKWTQKDQDELDELGFPDDISPEAIARYHAMLPPAVRAEIEKEADAQAKEMIQKFEEHAKAYEKEHPETAPKAKTPKAQRGKEASDLL